MRDPCPQWLIPYQALGDYPAVKGPKDWKHLIPKTDPCGISVGDLRKVLAELPEWADSLNLMIASDGGYGYVANVSIDPASSINNANLQFTMGELWEP